VNEANKGEVEETRGRGEGKRQRLRKLSSELRDSPFPLPQFIDLREPCSRELHALHALTVGDTVCR
jgi:hypothetical protein